MRWKPTLCVLLLLIFLPVAPCEAQKTWGVETQVTSANESSMSPSLALDSNNNVHIVWIDRRTNNRPQVYYAKLDEDGNKLIADTRINNTTFDNPMNSFIGVDSADNVHIVWAERRDGNNEIYYTKQDVNGNTLVDDLRVTNDSAYTETEGLAVDSLNNVHLVFEDKRSSSNFEIFYKKLDSNGAELVPDTQISFNTSFSQNAEIALDAWDSAHIVWKDYRDGAKGEIYYAKVDNTGTIVVDEFSLTASDLIDSEDPDVAVDNAGDLHIVWQDERDGATELYYLKADNIGSVLATDTRLTFDPATSQSPSISMTAAKELVVSWTDKRDGNNEIYVMRLDDWGNILMGDVRLTEADGLSSFPCLVSDASSEAFVVWQDDRDGDVELFFNRSNRCKEGTVNAGAGPVKPVLFVNGQIGGISRTVTVPAGYPISVAIQLPPAGGAGVFVVHGDAGSPAGSGQVKMPSAVGTTCFDFLLPPMGNANPAGVWNNIGFTEVVGSSMYLDGTPIPDPAPAPVSLISQILGDSTVLPVGAVYTFQGIMKDPGSASVKGASTTNAVTLKIQ